MTEILTIECGCYAPLWFKFFMAALIIAGVLLIKWFERGAKKDPKEIKYKKEQLAYREEKITWYRDMMERLSNVPMDWEAKETMALKIKKASGL